jgi:uroporphyrinogen decarboxylase
MVDKNNADKHRSMELPARMKSRERIAAILAHEEPDRVGFMDADTWQETVERWWREGMPRSVDNAWLNIEGLRYFGMDIYGIFAPSPRGKDQVILEDSSDFQVIRDQWGGKVKRWKHRSGPPLYLEPAVKKPEDFEDNIMRFFEENVADILANSSSIIKKTQEEFYVTVNVGGTFDLAMSLFGGLGRTLVLMLKHPEFMSKVFTVIGNYWMSIAAEYADLGVDGLWIFDDLGSRNGPFFSPELYRRLIMPAHKEICNVFRKRGLPVLLHSDGCLREFIPLFLECGFNAIHPIQVKAGMILADLKEIYGDRIVLFGGMDTDVLASGQPEAIKREVALKISQGAPGGGYIASCDGPVPPSVSLASYRLYIKAIKRYGRYSFT